MHRCFHTYTDTHKCHNTFKLTHLHIHVYKQPQTRTHARPTQDNTSPSLSAATENVKQLNLNMANENIGSCFILYCISY